MAKALIRPRAVPKAAPDFTSRAYWNGTIKMSLSKFFILCVLHERPMHGYDIATAVEEGGYVTVEAEVVSGRERKVYTLTNRGREAFKVAVEAWMDVTRCLIASEHVAAGGGRKRSSQNRCR